MRVAGHEGAVLRALVAHTLRGGFESSYNPPSSFCLLSHSSVENKHRLEEDSKITNKRTGIDILHIKQDALLIRDVLTPADLPQAGNTGPHGEPFLCIFTI